MKKLTPPPPGGREADLLLLKELLKEVRDLRGEVGVVSQLFHSDFKDASKI